MVDRQKPFTPYFQSGPLLESFSPLQISDTPPAGFKAAQNCKSDNHYTGKEAIYNVINWVFKYRISWHMGKSDAG